MPTIHVSRSIMIDAPKESIHNILMHLQNASHWSPWLKMESEAQVAFSDRQGEVGSGFSWNGELIGEGQMKIVHADEENIEVKIHFLKPFKSTAKSIFTLQEHEGQTEVIWHMQRTLPWFLFFMKNKMQAFIAMDYDRGLGMLKEYIEKGSVHSATMIEGVVEIEGRKYVGIPRTCSIQEVGEVMKTDYKRLFDFIAEHEILLEEMPFSIYNSFDIPNNRTEFISCIPYDGEVTLPSAFIQGEIPSQKAIKTVHTGSYKHLGNAWTAALSYARAKNIQTSKTMLGIEVYPNDPDDTPEELLTTEIYLPLK